MKERGAEAGEKAVSPVHPLFCQRVRLQKEGGSQNTPTIHLEAACELRPLPED